MKATRIVADSVSSGSEFM